ncbi:MAG: hypothetical protein P8Y53_05835, partial [Pseudolabrys sp.]
PPILALNEPFHPDPSLIGITLSNQCVSTQAGPIAALGQGGNSTKCRHAKGLNLMVGFVG